MRHPASNRWWKKRGDDREIERAQRGREMWGSHKYDIILSVSYYCLLFKPLTSIMFCFVPFFHSRIATQPYEHALQTLLYFHSLLCILYMHCEYLEQKKLCFPHLKVLRCVLHRSKWQTRCICAYQNKQNVTVITWINHTWSILHQLRVQLNQGHFLLSFNFILFRSSCICE